MSYPEWRDMLHDLRCIVPTTKHTPRMFMGQEVPALASHYILHPDGTLGFIHKNFEGKTWVCNQLTFGVEGVPINSTKFRGYLHLMEPLPNQESNNQQLSAEQEKNMKEFTKADLRNGMKVVLRNGARYVVLLDVDGHDILTNRDYGLMQLEYYSEDLQRKGGVEPAAWDIVEVYKARAGGYALLTNNLYNLIWKREEKSPEQEVYEALQQKIAEHEQTMKELKEQAEKLKPKG